MTVTTGRFAGGPACCHFTTIAKLQLQKREQESGALPRRGAGGEECFHARMAPAPSAKVDNLSSTRVQ